MFGFVTLIKKFLTDRQRRVALICPSYKKPLDHCREVIFFIQNNALGSTTYLSVQTITRSMIAGIQPRQKHSFAIILTTHFLVSPMTKLCIPKPPRNKQSTLKMQNTVIVAKYNRAKISFSLGYPIGHSLVISLCIIPTCQNALL